MKSRDAGVGLCCAIGAAAVCSASGTITDGNASFSIITGAGVGAGDADFRADPAAPDVVFQNQWWFRVNSSSTPQSQETRFQAPTSEVYSANTATLTWIGLGPSDGRFDAVLGVTLNDGGAAGTADVSFVLQITEATVAATQPLDISIFQYVDPDAAGTPSGDSATIIGAPAVNGHIMFTDGTEFVDFYGIQSAGYEVSTAPGVRNGVGDASVSVFTNTGAPAGPADLCAGHEWDRSIPIAGMSSFLSAITVNTNLPACSWDLNGDGAVNSFDLALLLGLWGNPFGSASLAQLLGSWGSC